MYEKNSDALTDKQYSSTSAFDLNYKYNNDFIVSFMCTEGEVRFEINADTLITSKNETFQFTYRVDKKDARQLTLRVFSNDNRGGYTYEGVMDIAKDILGGREMFVRAITWDNDFLDARISLSGSDSAIRKVFADCRINLDAGTKTPVVDYSFSKFESAFRKLTPRNQEKVLRELRSLMEKYSQ